ncbi:hypothetical protein RFI_30309 [Reticulomyxa filosa]|uniref:Uncharacterized protein n=1 Tax=Reticulomyxa filosa TaxID=46433 RepID=X6M0Z1_RETFI|nr:hypothetical protein RFI_30309 [Reticulomyxa filosa]|eukprot:ETO07082.1 hypothetical protein RFI_30309 [Reticulomyxa filosa]
MFETLAREKFFLTEKHCIFLFNKFGNCLFPQHTYPKISMFVFLKDTKNILKVIQTLLKLQKIEKLFSKFLLKTFLKNSLLRKIKKIEILIVLHNVMIIVNKIFLKVQNVFNTIKKKFGYSKKIIFILTDELISFSFKQNMTVSITKEKLHHFDINDFFKKN